MRVRSPTLTLRSFISRYRRIAFSRSTSIMARCAIESTPAALALAFPPDEECFAAPRGSFFSSGGARATSLRRRGAELDVVANSFGESSSSWRALASGDNGDASSAWAFDGLRVMEGGDALEACRVLFGFLLEEEAAAVAAFFALRSVAAEACTADRTSGRIWSSTLLNAQEKETQMKHNHEKRALPSNVEGLRGARKAHRLKCLSDSPGWISIVPTGLSLPLANALPLFPASALPAFVRRFLGGGGFDALTPSFASASSVWRRARFCRYSARILAASNTRAADLGMRSVLMLVPWMPPDGARSVPLGR